MFSDSQFSALSSVTQTQKTQILLVVCLAYDLY